MNISGNTRLIAHVGHPTSTFKAPMIYNPYFESIGLDCAVIPMGVTREHGEAGLRAVFRMTNVLGALITMPHKVSVVGMLDEVSTTVKVAGACNAVRVEPDGRLVGDMFDGEGFVRGLQRKGCEIRGARIIQAGAGGVGSAIAASLARAGARQIALFDPDSPAAEALAARLRTYYPALTVTTGSNDSSGYDIVINASPLGMKADDPLPFDPARIAPASFVGEVVMKVEVTPLLAAARALGCRTQVGIDMLFEMIPAYLEFFGVPTTTPDNLRALSRVRY